MFDDSIPLQDKQLLRDAEPLYCLPGELRLPPNIYDNFSLDDIEKSFISKEYENFHRIWRLDNLVPERSRRFFNEFPRVGSNWDSEHHTYNSDFSFVLRWFPAFSQNLFVAHWLFPDLSEQYFSGSPCGKDPATDPTRNSSSPARTGETPSTVAAPRADIASNLHHDEHNKRVVFRASPVPTRFECDLCRNLKGAGLHNRKGAWACYVVRGGTLDLEHDEFGPKFFVRYEDWNSWKKTMREKLAEAAARNDMERVRLIRKISYAG